MCITAQKELASQYRPSTVILHGAHSHLIDIEPGFVDDGRRILTHPPEEHEYDRIHNLPVPTVDDTTTILLKLINEENPGAHNYDVHRVLGSCRLCREMVGLCVAKYHSCAPEEVSRFSEYIARPFAAAWPPHAWILEHDAALTARFGSASSPANSENTRNHSAVADTPLNVTSSPVEPHSDNLEGEPLPVTLSSTTTTLH